MGFYASERNQVAVISEPCNNSRVNHLEETQETKMAAIYGDMLFNIDNGYLEGLVRGFRSGILKRTDYLNLIQCETLEGKMFVLRMNLL